MTFTDQTGRTVECHNKLTRIVSLVPSQTELLVDLGLEDNIVGVTKFCVHPKHLRISKKVIGGTKTISFEKIKALKPHIILCNKEENTLDIVNQLEKEFPVHVSDVTNIEESKTLILQYGKLFGCIMRASRMCSIITKEADKFTAFIADKPKKRTAYFIWKDPWMTIGKDTFIHYLLSLNQFENIYQDKERYPEVDLEDLKEKNPELLLLSSEPYPFKEKHINEIQSTFPETKIILVDGEYFSWYGSRLQNAFTYFRTLHA